MESVLVAIANAVLEATSKEIHYGDPVTVAVVALSLLLVIFALILLTLIIFIAVVIGKVQFICFGLIH
jgi:hypothetical protein